MAVLLRDDDSDGKKCFQRRRVTMRNILALGKKTGRRKQRATSDSRKTEKLKKNIQRASVVLIPRKFMY
jgi:hypothetical protein